MRPALLLFFVLAVPLHASEDFETALAADPRVLEIFATLLADGGLGFRDSEAAAFITIDESGGYRCQGWPFRNGHQKQIFRGALPEFTVAIAHTHPKGSRRPSPADRETARAIGLPVFVLTPRDIWVATPEGAVAPLVVNRMWATALRGVSSCAERPQSPIARIAD
ncbi:MAG TPA: Mov34/MPN/PAD-1 family protein [Thermoanaerobaculia bacterium]|nr:Mov34/MPN/PAD-1 family protein [Thermoanaerobaculia bacterium]